VFLIGQSCKSPYLDLRRLCNIDGLFIKHAYRKETFASKLSEGQLGRLDDAYQNCDQKATTNSSIKNS